MNLTEKANDKDGHTRFFITNTNSHHKLVLMEQKDLPPASGRVLQQIAFEVPDHETFVRYYHKLKGQSGLELKDNRISWSIYVEDPDKNQVEIFWDIRNKPFGAKKWEGKSEDLPEKTLLKGSR